MAEVEALLRGAGLEDADLVEYLVGMIEEPARDWEAVQALLSSYVCDDDDEAAAALCGSIQRVTLDDDGDDTTGVVLLEVAKKGFEEEDILQAASKEVWGAGQSKYTNEVRDAEVIAVSKRDERKALKAVKHARLRLDTSVVVDDVVAAMSVPDRESAKGFTRDVHVSNFDIHFGGSTLLRGAELHLASGRRYGLIGPNGAGKTTLLRYMAKFDLPGFPRHLRVLHVRQEVSAEGTINDLRVVDAVVATDAEIASLRDSERRLNATLSALEATPAEAAAAHVELAAVSDSLAQLEAETAESRAASILDGLGFTAEMQLGKFGSLSGGWRVRAALAGALFVAPDLLMLDEPTNHLDLEAVIWLQDYLEKYERTVVLVSHDRAFLDAVTTDCILVKDLALHAYKGNYNTFVNTREEALIRQRREYDAYKLERSHMQEFIDRFRCSASRAALVQSRIKAAEKMDAEAPAEPKAHAQWRFVIAAADPLQRPVLQAESVAFSYPGDKQPLLFQNVDFDVDNESRVALLGANGSGKSTLLKLLLGELAPTSGTVHRKHNLKVEFFTQHHADQLDLAISPLENMQKRFRTAPEASLRAHLGQFAMTGDDALKPTRNLSGGQKSRVAFAMLAFAKPHIIVLDEPTNHLDIEAIDALVDALRKFKGGVLVVSHDQHFLSNVCNTLYVVGNNKLKRFEGTIEDYKLKTLKSKANKVARASK